MRRVVIFFAISMILHSFLFFVSVKIVNRDRRYKPPIKVKMIEMPQKEKQKEEINTPKQIVDLPDDPDSERPDDAKYSSNTNHKVEKETISKNKEASKNPTHEKIEGQKEEKKQEKKFTKKEPKFKEDKNGTMKNPKDINLFPDQNTINKIAGSPMNDSVEEEEADGTFLNSVRFKHAGYFNRIKRCVSHNWRPIPELVRKDPRGKKYMYKQQTTILSVTLDENGCIKNLVFKRNTGIDFVDKEAYSAFRKCRCFPNPPKEMIKSGEIKFDFRFDIKKYSPNPLNNIRIRMN